MRRRTVLVVLVGAVSLVAASCSDGTDATPPDPSGRSTSTAAATSTSVPGDRAGSTIPGKAWERATPAAAGLDPAALDEVVRTADVGRSRCLAVVRDGKLVGDWYFRDGSETEPQDVFSITKSITSILVGIARDDGDLDLDDPASRWIEEWKGTPAEDVTVRDLLSMDSGRQWSLALDYVEFLKALDRTQFAVDLQQQHAPGEVWAYNNAAVQTLQRVLLKATGTPVQEFAQDRLFGPLGMARTTMAVDNAGNAQMFEGVGSTCQDLARFGLMLLRQGRWGDEQIVSADYVRAATATSSTELNVGYGYLFWMNHEGPVSGPLVATDIEALKDPKIADGQLAPGAPTDLFWALGLGNQVVQVDPGSRTVVVRLGEGGPRPQPPTFGPVEASRVVTEVVER